MLPHRLPDTPLRVALLGAGTFVRGAHVPALRAHTKRVEVVGVCARREQRALEVAHEFGSSVRTTASIDEALAWDEAEAVLVALPIELQPDVVRAALAAGKHVLSEKPIATDPATSRDLLDTYSECGTEWMVAENWRYESVFVRAAELVRAGAIGRPLQGDWSMHAAIRPGHPYHATAWRRTGSIPGGFLLDAGVHYLAVLRMILGEPSAVTATTLQSRDDLPPADTLSALLAFPGGATVSLGLSFGAAAPWESELRLVGDEGSLRASRRSLTLERDGRTTEETFDYPTGVRAEWGAFIDRIRRGTPHRNSPHEAARDVEVALAMLRSAETRTWYPASPDHG